MEKHILKASSGPGLYFSCIGAQSQSNRRTRTVRTSAPHATVASAKASKNKKEDTNLPLPAWLTT